MFAPGFCPAVDRNHCYHSAVVWLICSHSDHDCNQESYSNDGSFKQYFFVECIHCTRWWFSLVTLMFLKLFAWHPLGMAGLEQVSINRWLRMLASHQLLSSWDYWFAQWLVLGLADSRGGVGSCGSISEQTISSQQNKSGFGCYTHRLMPICNAKSTNRPVFYQVQCYQ